jgi:hypothetical protein
MAKSMLGLFALAFAAAAFAQGQSTGDASFEAGRPLGVMAGDVHTPISVNVKVYGAVANAESCIYDSSRKLIMVVNRGAAQTEAPNDGFVSLLNSDGSVHTAKWIGATRAGLILNHPFGSDIHDGRLYLADSDGGTADGASRVSVLRLFDIASGAPVSEIRVEDSSWFNDIAVAPDGTVYATQSGTANGETPMRVYKITRAGEAIVLIEGAPLAIPNGIAIDGEGNLVVVNIGNKDVPHLLASRNPPQDRAGGAGRQ